MALSSHQALVLNLCAWRQPRIDSGESTDRSAAAVADLSSSEAEALLKVLRDVRVRGMDGLAMALSASAHLRLLAWCADRVSAVEQQVVALDFTPLLADLDDDYVVRMLEAWLRGGQRSLGSLAVAPAESGSFQVSFELTDLGRGMLPVLRHLERGNRPLHYVALKNLMDLFDLQLEELDRAGFEDRYLRQMVENRDDKARLLEFVVAGIVVDVGAGSGALVGLLETMHAAAGRIIALERSPQALQDLQQRRILPEFEPAALEDRIDVRRAMRVGYQAGSNLGAAYRMEDGSCWYVKKLTSDEHARNEKLASDLYRALGIAVPEARMAVWEDGATAIATRMVEGERLGEHNLEAALQAYPDLANGFAADAWLANWDVLGADADNILVCGATATRVDVGGSLLYRARGAAKEGAWSEALLEWDKMLMFSAMTPQQLVRSGRRVLRLSEDRIRRIVEANGFHESLAETLIARRRVIAGKVAELEQSTGACDEVEVVLGDACDLRALLLERGIESVSTVIFCSVLHEIFSYGRQRFDARAVEEALLQAIALLRVGGRILIRDGVVPEDGEEEQVMSLHPHATVEFFKAYADHFEGFPIAFQILKETDDYAHIRLRRRAAMEFMYTFIWGRKAFPYEVREQYGVMRRSEYVALIEELGRRQGVGMREVPIPLEWQSYVQPGYLQHLQDRVALSHLDGTEAPYPPSNMLLVMERVS